MKRETSTTQEGRPLGSPRSRGIGTVGPAVAAAVLTMGGSSHADDLVSACIDSSDRGQVAREAGRRIEARERFVACAKEGCPGPIRRDCSGWLADVEARIPTIALRARDGAGRDLVQVRVLDGASVVADRIDGRAIAVDPGVHDLRFEREGFPAMTIRLVVREGEKQRAVDVSWPAPAPPSAKPNPDEALAPPWPAIPTVAWILGGVGVVALGGFGWLGWEARSEHPSGSGRATDQYEGSSPGASPPSPKHCIRPLVR